MNPHQNILNEALGQPHSKRLLPQQPQPPEEMMDEDTGHMIARGGFEILTPLGYELMKARKLQGRLRVHGMNISVENAPGSVRTGTDADGKKWKTVMKNHYGYIRGTMGVDGDHIDVFVGPNTDASKVWVVHQHVEGSYDEDKVMLGFNTKTQAIAAYRCHYDKPDKFLGPVTELTIKEFKDRIKDSRDNPKRLGVGRWHRGKHL